MKMGQHTQDFSTANRNKSWASDISRMARSIWESGTTTVEMVGEHSSTIRQDFGMRESGERIVGTAMERR